jgi:hypothetical protein
MEGRERGIGRAEKIMVTARKGRLRIRTDPCGKGSKYVPHGREGEEAERTRCGGGDIDDGRMERESGFIK